MRFLLVAAPLFAADVTAGALSIASCKGDAPDATRGSSPPPAAAPEPEASFNPAMPSYKCGTIRCNIDYYCVQRKRGEPTEICTTHPPSSKREGCSKIATRSYVCESFP